MIVVVMGDYAQVSEGHEMDYYAADDAAEV